MLSESSGATLTIKQMERGMAKKAIAAAPLKAVGPYSLAMDTGSVVYISGQVHLDGATGKLVGDDVAAQTHQVFNNLKLILDQAGLGFQHIVKVTVFLTDMGDFAAMNEVYKTYMSEPYPARSTIAVAGLPLGARLEIEAIADRNA